MEWWNLPAHTDPLPTQMICCIHQGIKGVGFIYSPLLQQPGRVYAGLMSVMDWFPTIFGLAGGKFSTIADKTDGVDQWKSLSLADVPHPRSELLHNIDPLGLVRPSSGTSLKASPAPFGFARAAIRVGHMKLMLGAVGMIGSDVPQSTPWVAPPNFTPPAPPALPPYCRNYSTSDRSLIFLYNISR